MKITVWGINYYPELVGIAVYNAELCDFLAERGHEVRMITGFPYYPTWIKLPAHRRKLFKQERIGKVEVMRNWLFVPRSPSVLKRMIHELSFVVTSFINALTLPSDDVYIVVSPPLLLGVAASVLSWIKRRPFIYHIQDLQPDAALRLGMLKPGLLVSVLYALQKFSYRNATYVASIAERMCETIISEGAPPEKVILLPNWTKRYSTDEMQAGAWKQKHGIDPRRPIVSYTGNLGAKQGLEIILWVADVARKQGRFDPLFVIAGNGGNEAMLKQLYRDKALSNVLFFDVLSAEEHTALLVDSDVCVIPQKSGSSMAFLPSKLLKILALGRPVVTNADPGSPLADAITDGGFGLLVTPADGLAFAQAIDDLLANDDARKKMGDCGRQYVTQFERERVLSRFENQLLDLKQRTTASASRSS